MTNLSLRSYLRSSLQAAIDTVFPSLNFTIAPDSFYLCREPECDLSNPAPLRISSLAGISAESAAERIMSVFNWADSFVVPDPMLIWTIKRGFLNFRISKEYLHLILLETGKPLPSFRTNNKMLERTVSLLKASGHFQSSDKMAATRLDLLNTKEEKLLEKIIALSGSDAFTGRKPANFFRKCLMVAFNDFYLKHPVFSDSEELTCARVLLVRAVHNHLCFLLEKEALSDS